MAVDVELVRRRFTLDEYHRMAEVGILNEDDRVELIRGEIVQLTPISLWPQNPLVIPPDSEPEPDVVLLTWRDDFYRHALPGPADVVLLIEVADTSLRYDRRVKGSLYAEAGVRNSWIVDLQGDAVEIHREPESGGFRRVERLGRGAVLAPVVFPDVTLAVADLLREGDDPST